MGIKNINILLTKKCKDCIVKKHLKSYCGKMLAIDTSIFLYKYLYNNDDHIEGFTRQILRLLKNGIIPLYVFDGEPPKEKDAVLQYRYTKKLSLINKKNELEKELQNLNDTEGSEEVIAKTNTELQKINKKIIKVTSRHIDQCKELFTFFGVPFVTSPGEAECLCAKLCKDDIVHGCISEDTDILANGSKKFIRNFNASTNFVIEYNLNNILDSLVITYSQFLDICILCGCDYTGKISGIGPLSAYKFIKMYGNLDNLIVNIKERTNPKLVKYTVPPYFEYKKAKQIFIETDKLIDSNKYKNSFSISKPQILNLIDFLKKNTELLHTKYLKEINKSLFNYYSNLIN